MEKAVLFGSRAMGLARSNSDVDILLYGDALQTRDVLRVANLLDATTLPYQFDLIRHDANNAALLKHVRDYGKVIFQRQETASQSKAILKNTGMTSKWDNVSLEDVAEELTVGYVGTMASEYVDKGIPFLRSLNIEPFRINDNDLKFITPEFHQRIRKSRLTPGDVVIVRTGKPGTCAVVPDWLTDANCSDLVIVRCGQKLHNRFLAYYINSIAASHVEAHLVGAVQQHFNVASARSLRIDLPPLPVQRAIAHILGTLDDKIELNRRINETLEAMARALFKAWLLDFEPVRAKLEGRWRRGQSLPGLPAHIYDLFPDRLVESEMGEVPDGWGLGMLSDVLSLRNERTRASQVTSVLPYVPIESISAKNPFLSSWVDGSEAKSSLILFKRGDILFGAMRPYFHKVCIAPFDGVTRTTVFTLKVSKPECSAYALMLAFQTNTVEYATLHSEGSTIPYAKWNGSFAKMPIILPPTELQAEYSSSVHPLFEKASMNIQQSHFLTQLRDTLLPKLISGELRIQDAKRIVGAS